MGTFENGGYLIFPFFQDVETLSLKNIDVSISFPTKWSALKRLHSMSVQNDVDVAFRFLFRLFHRFHAPTVLLTSFIFLLPSSWQSRDTIRFLLCWQRFSYWISSLCSPTIVIHYAFRRQFLLAWISLCFSTVIIRSLLCLCFYRLDRRSLFWSERLCALCFVWAFQQPKLHSLLPSVKAPL